MDVPIGRPERTLAADALRPERTLAAAMRCDRGGLRSASAALDSSSSRGKPVSTVQRIPHIPHPTSHIAHIALTTHRTHHTSHPASATVKNNATEELRRPDPRGREEQVATLGPRRRDL